MFQGEYKITKKELFQMRFDKDDIYRMAFLKLVEDAPIDELKKVFDFKMEEYEIEGESILRFMAKIKSK